MGCNFLGLRLWFVGDQRGRDPEGLVPGKTLTRMRVKTGILTCFLLTLNTPSRGSIPFCRAKYWYVLVVTLLNFLPQATQADTIRIAQFNVALGRDGPGLLLKDILAGDDPQVNGIARIIAHTNPDILLLNEFDYDSNLIALTAFADLLRKEGVDYPYLFAQPVNSGTPSGIDLNMDGRTNGAEDAYGFGRFTGQNGMVILSRFEIDDTQARSFRNLLWRDLPDANLPRTSNGSDYYSPEALDRFRLSSKSHWDVPILVNDQTLHLLASHPTPPVFDGPEDANGWRNHDEITFWRHYIDGTTFVDDQGRSQAFDGRNFVILGTLNADPVDGDGRHAAIQALLSHPKIYDPMPVSEGAEQSSSRPDKINSK